MSRNDGRGPNEVRQISIDLGLQRNPEGSVLYRAGGTTVLIAASVVESVPEFLRDSGRGWLTAEYVMHPRANPSRQAREGLSGKVSGRSQEISRLIGRALRASVRLERLGARTINIDCDVLDADGGTRTAAITGGFVALVCALHRLKRDGLVAQGIVREPTAAVSVAKVGEVLCVDPNYAEDSRASCDLNVVATAAGRMIEVQGTAEDGPIARDDFFAMQTLAVDAIVQLTQTQHSAIERAGIRLDALLG